MRKGDKVRVLPPRGSTGKGDARLWQVVRIIKKVSGTVAELKLIDAPWPQPHKTVPLGDLIVVVEFRNTIYRGW